MAAERLPNRLDVFPIDAQGAAGTPALNASHGKMPFALTFVPQGAFLVAEAAGDPAGGSAVSSCEIAVGDALQIVTPSLPTDGNAACWIAATPDGHYAYVANAASGQISVDGIDEGGALTPLGAFIAGAGSIPLDVAVTGNGRYLYALTAGQGTITGFRIDAGGSLTPAATDPAPSSGQNGLAAF